MAYFKAKMDNERDEWMQFLDEQKNTTGKYLFDVKERILRKEAGIAELQTAIDECGRELEMARGELLAKKVVVVDDDEKNDDVQKQPK